MRALIIAFMLLLLAGCKTIEKIEYVDRYHNTHSTDTLIRYDKDSVFVDHFIKGDTVFKTKYVEKIRYKDKIQIVTDTIRQSEVKTVIETKSVVPGWCYKAIIFLLIALIFLSIYCFVIKK